MDDVAISTAPSYPIDEDKSEEQAAIEQEQTQEDYSLAALIDHPGWKQIHDKMKLDIDRIRSLKEVNFAEYEDAALGQVVRGEFQLAAKLETYLNQVESAVEAIREK